MKSLIILALTILVIAIAISCKKESSKPKGASYTPFVQTWPIWRNGISLKGADTLIQGFPDVITAIGSPNNDSFYGQYLYRNDTYTICKRGSNTIHVKMSPTAANNYSDLTGDYDTVELHKSDGSGSDWTGTFGLYQYDYGRQFYMLYIATQHTSYGSVYYTDSL